MNRIHWPVEVDRPMTSYRPWKGWALALLGLALLITALAIIGRLP